MVFGLQKEISRYMTKESNPLQKDWIYEILSKTGGGGSGLITVHGLGAPGAPKSLTLRELGAPGAPGAPEATGAQEPRKPREPLFASWSSSWCWQVEGQGAIGQRKSYFCKQYTFINSFSTFTFVDKELSQLVSTFIATLMLILVMKWDKFKLLLTATES